jgi:molybdate/tungstate transport system substrate-binding protein
MIQKYITFFLGCLFFISTSCQRQQEVIKVFHAGSLSVPLHAIAEAYENLHPGVKVQLEGAGSLTCIRKITELHKACDVLAVADYALIDQLMIPDYTSFNILFAGNKMAIGYEPGSKWGNEISETNWHEILLREDIHFGRSNPNHDPSGYRTEIVMGLAEKQLQIPGLQQGLLNKDQKFIRPKGTELLPLLETGAIDFIFHYSSVLQQHNLSVLWLPDSLNLSNPALDDWYASVCTEVDGTSSEQRITKCGEAMVYGICLPNNGGNPNGATQFLEFVLTNGRDILENHGQPTIQPVLSPKSIEIPAWYSSIIN